MLRQVNNHRRHNSSSLIFIPSLLIIMVIINSVIARSVNPDSNLTIDKSEVPERYLYEIDEDNLNEINKSIPKNQNDSDYRLMFNMPIAVAVLFAVILLVCCFCCLRCAVTYDGIKRSGKFYQRPDKSNVVNIVKILRSSNREPIINDEK